MRHVLTSPLLLSVALSCWAGCMPEKMVKVVFRDATPGVDPESFAAKPKTLYRLGSKYGRSEEQLDSALNIHGLTVVNEPDLWVVNLATKTGQHVVDTGAPYHFHAPVVGGPDDPKAILALEFGCELEYMKANAVADPKMGMLDGRQVDQYEVTVEKYRVVLSVSRKDGKPLAFALYDDGKLTYDMRYLEYAIDLKPRTKLFEKPDGIDYTEAE